MQVKGEVKVHGLGFSMDLDCLHRSSLPVASCCLVNQCFLSFDVVVGGVGKYSHPILLIPLLHCLLVFAYSHLQCSLCLSDACAPRPKCSVN